MRAFGLTAADVRARVSDRRLLQGLLGLAGIGEAQLPLVYAVVDKLEREPRESLERKLADAGLGEPVIRRLFEVLSTTDLASLRREYGDVPELRDDFARFARYEAYLEALGVLDWVTFDLSIVRGLAYYTGIVFELFDARGELRAICGGGRYDNLLSALGGADLPALGFGMGDVVLGELLRERGLMRPPPQGLDFWVGADNPDLTPDVMRIAQRLRGAGYAVEYPLRRQSLDKQRKAARAAGATRIIEVPDDFASTGLVRMAFADPAAAQAGGQSKGGQEIPLDSLVEHLRSDAAAITTH